MNALPSPAPSLASDYAAFPGPHLPAEHARAIVASSYRVLDQAPPPTLREILSAYRTKGDGDRDMLLAMLGAKSAEDQRLAASATLHKTILDLHLTSADAQASAAAAAAYPTPSPYLHAGGASPYGYAAASPRRLAPGSATGSGSYSPALSSTSSAHRSYRRPSPAVAAAASSAPVASSSHHHHHPYARKRARHSLSPVAPAALRALPDDYPPAPATLRRERSPRSPSPLSSDDERERARAGHSVQVPLVSDSRRGAHRQLRREGS